MSIIRFSKKIFNLLNKHQKFRIFELGILMFIGAFLETLTVILFGVFANCLMDTSVTQTSKLLVMFSSATGITAPEKIIMIFAIGLAFLYIFKNLYTIWEYGIQVGFTSSNSTIMQDEVLRKVMARPYEFFLYADSGEMIRFATQDVVLVFDMISQLLSFYTEFVVSASLIVVALIETPMMSIGIAGLLAVSLLAVMKGIKPRIEYIGKETRRLKAVTNKSFIEIIEGIKEVKVLRKEDYFRENYYKSSMGVVRLQKRYSILRLLPKNIIESVCMAGVFILTAVLIFSGSNLDAILSSIALTAMVAMRLLPSVNRISSVLTQISLNEEVIDSVSKIYNESYDDEKTVVSSDEDKLAPNNHADKLTFNDKLEISALSYSYPDSDKLIIDNANLTIHKGESIGVVGPSGGGKSTFLNILLGLLPPVTGNIQADGTSIFHDREAWLSHIGYIPQSIFIVDENIRENIAFGVKPDDIDDDKVREVIKAAALEDYVNSLPNGIYSSVGERGLRISGGQRQRIGIARALYFNPDILFFDEATSALDVSTEAEIMKSIDALKGKITMVIVAHRYTTVQGCDRIWRVQDGQISEIDKRELE